MDDYDFADQEDGYMETIAELREELVEAKRDAAEGYRRHSALAHDVVAPLMERVSDLDRTITTLADNLRGGLYETEPANSYKELADWVKAALRWLGPPYYTE